MTDRVTCNRCAVHYRPDRTDLACPVCRTPAPGSEPGDAAAAPVDLRMVAIGVSAVDFLLLAGVAWWLFG